MSYQSVDVSVEGGSPVFLYLFNQDSTTYRYTSGATTINYDGNDWTPGVILPTKFAVNADITKNGLSLTVPRDNPMVSEMITYSPDTITTLTVFRMLRGEPTVETYWKGRLVNIGIDGNRVTLECESVNSALKRPGLRAVISRNCRHPLYGNGCWVDPEDYVLSAEITAVSGSVLTVPSLLTLSNTDPLNGGIVKAADGTQRMIVAHFGVTVRLIRPLKALQAEMTANPGGFSASFYPGCDHTSYTCINKFNNLLNYGGFPFLPGKNPFKNPVL